MRASLAEAVLQEDAAAAAQLEAAGRRLDSLADSLAQLEGRQGNLQVGVVEAPAGCPVHSCCGAVGSGSTETGRLGDRTRLNGP